MGGGLVVVDSKALARLLEWLFRQLLRGGSLGHEADVSTSSRTRRAWDSVRRSFTDWSPTDRQRSAEQHQQGVANSQELPVRINRLAAAAGWGS
jgi:hypothetical protein